MRLNLCCFLAAVGVSMFVAPAAGQQTPAPFVPDFKMAAPLSATRLAAERAGLPIDSFVAPAGRPELQRGDAITALVSLTEGKNLTQWIVQLRSVDMTEKETQLPPLPDSRFYTCTGQEFNFAGKRAALEIRMIGPLKSGTTSDEKAVRAAKDQTVRVLVNSEYLRLGFDRACAAWLRMRDTGKGQRLEWQFSTEKFTPEKVVVGKQAAAVVGLTVDDESALTGTCPALLEFFNIALQTVALRDVLSKVADIPWWQLIKHGGQPQIDLSYFPQFARGVPGEWRLPAGEDVWFLPVGFNLFKKPVLACQLAVTAPRPPLLTSAGIVGVAAQRPDGKGPHLMIQVVATRAAAGENLEKISVK